MLLNENNGVVASEAPKSTMRIIWGKKIALELVPIKP